jgi:hypothetical protein
MLLRLRLRTPSALAAARIALRESKLSKSAPETPGVLYDYQRNARRVSIARCVTGKIVMLIEGLRSL